MGIIDKHNNPSSPRIGAYGTHRPLHHRHQKGGFVRSVMGERGTDARCSITGVGQQMGHRSKWHT